MRQIANVVRVSTVVLAVFIGASASHAATPRKGPTGKTRIQCYSDLNDCRIGCNQLIDIGDTIQLCRSQCGIDFLLCLPPRTADDNLAEDTLLGGQVEIRQELDTVLTKLTHLRTDLLAVSSTCSPPDLLPLPRPASSGPEGFCRFNADLTKLQVQVTNQGSTASGGSTTHVRFANNPGVDVATPTLSYGGSAVAEFDIPPSCYDASNNCYFTIGVDFANAVSESDEVNNNVAGVCGPGIQ